MDDSLYDLYRKRAQLGYDIQNGYPYKLPEYEALQEEIRKAERQWGPQYHAPAVRVPFASNGHKA